MVACSIAAPCPNSSIECTYARPYDRLGEFVDWLVAHNVVLKDWGFLMLIRRLRVIGLPLVRGLQLGSLSLSHWFQDEAILHMFMMIYGTRPGFFSISEDSVETNAECGSGTDLVLPLPRRRQPNQIHSSQGLSEGSAPRLHIDS